jgi:hypothetical protein
VGPVGDKIGSPRPPLAGVALTPWFTRAHAAQGGVTLGPEQGDLGANFCYLGSTKIRPELTFPLTHTIPL